MPTSEARIRANQANAALSTGPKTPEGKAVSRANSYKHGMTGAGVVMPAEEAAEVEHRFASFRDELNPSGSVGLTLVRRAATLAVRMEKCAERELAAKSERVAQALAEFTPPDGADPAEVARLRAEAGRQAAFDPSREACLARRYEAEAERGFFRALRELRLVEKQARAAQPAGSTDQFRRELGSILERSDFEREMEAEYPELTLAGFQNPFAAAVRAQLAQSGVKLDVPMTIGRAR